MNTTTPDLLTAAQDARTKLRAAEVALEEAARACAVAKQAAVAHPNDTATRIWGDRVGRTRTLAAQLRRIAGNETSRGNVLR